MRHGGGETLARAYPLSIRRRSGWHAPRETPEVAAAEREVLERRRKHLIIRVDRADLSKNVLRGFTAFDTFLTQHPEFREEVTFIAHLQPSRQDRRSTPSTGSGSRRLVVRSSTTAMAPPTGCRST